jgi:anti-sigma regulatory factor (Ser/Thr protein kinase)/N-acetylglutamate synthase-like GNAT family acetyltransferase
MEKNITLSIPNQVRYLPLAVNVVREAAHLAEISEEDVKDIVTASRELIFNAIRHAYPKNMSGMIDIDILFLRHGIQISVHDMGLPFDFDGYMASERTGGLKAIADYVDELRFSNLGRRGKSFTIFKSHPLDLDDVVFQPYSDLEDESPASLKPASIQIRDYECGDEEAISRLIYNNYTYSYYKSLFYYPKKIRELNESGEIASVVAETREGKIVGHFALVMIENANIAEIGVAVVHPDYKGMGIMNAMLDRIQQRARELKLDAIFGEALMLHPYSQRANLRHGFGESALLLGIVPNTVSLTDPNAVRTDKRSAVLIGYKILSGATSRRIVVPKRYETLVRRIYANNRLAIEPLETPECETQSRISYELSHHTQTGTIVIDSVPADFAHSIRHYLHILYKKHVDMIYADINLMKCAWVDEAVEILKEEGFVFSGVLFYRKEGCDYLRMQLPNSDNVETERIVCHSDFCSNLLQTISGELAAF